MDNLGMETENPEQFAGPVVVQPGANMANWLQRPEVPLGCPPGLEYLSQIDQIIVKQQIELVEVYTDWEVANRYRLLNSVGQQVYFAQEESEACMRQSCGSDRGFVMHITDNAGREVMRATREFQCCGGCVWCPDGETCSRPHIVTVEAPVGSIIGQVREEYTNWNPHFSISTQSHGKVGVIRGPCCPCQCPFAPKEVVFGIFNPQSEDTEIGSINKQWSGCGVEQLTDADTFSVSFPMDMDVRTKAVFIGATFLIDFMYFEHN